LLICLNNSSNKLLLIVKFLPTASLIGLSLEVANRICQRCDIERCSLMQKRIPFSYNCQDSELRLK